MWNKHRTKLLAGLIAAQILFLAGIAGVHYTTGWWGQVIRIKTAPVDPRDMMYGDYVILNYDISLLNDSQWKSSGPLPNRGEPVYVRLVKQGDNYEAASFYQAKPSVGAGEVVLRARVEYRTETGVRVRYGLEKYYVAENQGKPLEEKAGKLVAVVQVAPWGTAQLNRLEDVR